MAAAICTRRLASEDSLSSRACKTACKVAGISSHDTLLNTQVNQLIQAMATFSASHGGSSWDQAIQDRPDEVQTVLAAYWQPPA